MTETNKQNLNIPPGWQENPSRWGERIPVAILAGLGFCVALYLTLYQVGFFAEPFDPIFGSGSSEKVLHSSFSNLLPVPDASLGTVAYLVELIACLAGPIERWRRMPWLVFLYGLSAAGLGSFSTLLVIFQPVLFEHWCSLCLVSAVISIYLFSAPLAEVLASLQQLKRAHRSGSSVWSALWGRGQEKRRTPGSSALPPVSGGT